MIGGATTSPLWPAVVGVAIVVVAMAVCVGPVLRRLPEPDLGPTDPLSSSLSPSLSSSSVEPDKVPYARLPSRWFVGGCALSAGLAAVVVVSVTPPPLRPPWLVLCTVGVLLAWIDGRTTWLPWRLTSVGWLAMLAAGGVSVLLGAGWGDLLRMLAGGGLAGVWYVLLYLLTRRRLGLGDVWLAPLIGAPAGLISFSHLYAALLLGSVVGGLHGLVLLLRGHRGGFPYAPSMVAGPFLALLVLHLIR